MTNGSETMRLSEAMRLGAMLKPQAFGGERQIWRVPVPGWRGWLLGKFVMEERTCAMQAALDAHPCPVKSDASNGVSLRGEPDPQQPVIEVPPDWQAVLFQHLPCPCCEEHMLVIRLVPHLNDTHLLSREAIADWIEGLEQQLLDAGPDPMAGENATANVVES